MGQLTDMLRGSLGEQSGLYRAAFAVEKAFAIATAVMDIQAGIAKAAANPWPMNLAAMASVAAATAGIVSNIQAVGMAHDSIDAVPQTGTWLLQKGERVTTAATSAKLDATLERVGRESVPSGGNTFNQDFHFTGKPDDAMVQMMELKARRAVQQAVGQVAIGLATGTGPVAKGQQAGYGGQRRVG